MADQPRAGEVWETYVVEWDAMGSHYESGEFASVPDADAFAENLNENATHVMVGLRRRHVR